MSIFTLNGTNTITTSSLNNTGTLEVDGILSIAATVAQVSGNTLTGGTWDVLGTPLSSSILSINSAGSLTTIGTTANVDLTEDGFFTNLVTLSTIEKGGSFSLGDQSFTTQGDLSNAGSVNLSVGTLDVTGNLSNTGSANLSNSTLNVTGTVAQLSGTSLNGGTWKIGPNSNLNFAAGSNITALTGAKVTLNGANSNFVALANLAKIGGASSFSLQGGVNFTTAGNLSNAGSVNLTDGTLDVTGNLSNTGSDNLSNSTLNVTGTVAQLSGTSLNGGTWNIGPNSNLNFAAGSNITALTGAKVTLNGANSNFVALANLTEVGSTSSFSLQGEANFTTVSSFTDDGMLTVGPHSIVVVTGAFTQASTATVARSGPTS